MARSPVVALEGAKARRLEHVAEQLHVPLVVLHHEDLPGRSSLDRLHREREHERASLTDLAVAPDAAVHLDESLRQREPETGSLVVPGASASVCWNSWKIRVQIPGGDARPCVGDREF